MNIGIDFGSTYSIISNYVKEKEMVEALTLSESSPYLPTEVSLKGAKYSFGTAAKSQNGKIGVRPFKSFKMLLAEGNDRIKKERGYDEENSPEKITQIFLEYSIKKALDIRGEKQIENLVIGAPEIWSRKINTIDVRAKLRDICKEMPFVSHVEVVSEPAAASAYFAYNFYQSYKKYYEGTILLIDYGGGTLDVTLTEVRTRKDKGDVGMEIKVLERTGVGENEDGHIGKAGIVFMESVVSRAIRDAGLDLSDEDLYGDPKFYRAVNEFEQALQSRTEDIQDVFDQYEDETSVIDEADDLFTDIEFKGEEVYIRYSLIRKVYNDIIYGVLDEQLEKMISFMKKRNLPFMDREQDTFKIALVGGFGNFYLVNKQVEEKFKWTAYDQRRKGIINAREDRERAISFGAALLADRIVTIQHTAPYSVGLYLPTYENSTKRSYSGKYAIGIGENIQNNEIHYQMSPGPRPAREKILFAGIEYIIISRPLQPDKCIKATLTREMVNIIKSMSSQELQVAYVGFSMDASEVLSIHIEPDGMKPRKIELAKLTDLIISDKLIEMDYMPQK